MSWRLEFHVIILIFQIRMTGLVTRTFLSASRLLRVPTRGKALDNWARPSIAEMGVPTESWAAVCFRYQILTKLLMFYFRPILSAILRATFIWL